jgi:DNA-binding NtrC family response regulator
MRVADLPALALPEQRTLLGCSASGERVVLLAPALLSELESRQALEPELVRAMDPLPLLVPPLFERREEIPALVRVLADNAAHRESVPPLTFRDEAVAALWRQDWRGNVRELEALVHQLAIGSPGCELSARDVRVAMQARGLEFRARLPSRRPKARDIELALLSTRHRSGAENQRRAARYLGWHPATLAERRRGRRE